MSSVSKCIEMFTQPGPIFPKDSKAIKMCAKQEFQSKMPQNIPVTIEIFGKKNVPQDVDRFKFLVPCCMTVSQFIFIIKNKLDLNPYQDFHLLLKKGEAALKLSQYIGSISSNYKDKHGRLHFTLTSESIFGCPRPRMKPVRAKFPGNDPTPFGAPEPTALILAEQNGWLQIEEGQGNLSGMIIPDIEDSHFVQAIAHITQNAENVIPNYPLNSYYLPPLSAIHEESTSEGSVHSMSPFLDSFMQGIHQLQTSLFLLSPTVISLSKLVFSLLPPNLLQMYPHYYVVILKLNQLVPYAHLHLTLQSNHVIEPISETSLSPEHYAPLVEVFYELVRELKNQLETYAIEGAESTEPVALTPDDFEPTPVHFLTCASNSLNSTHDYFQTLHQNLSSQYSSADMMVGLADDASEPPVHPALSALVQYMRAVCGFVKTHQVLTTTDFEDGSNPGNIPLLTLPNSVLQYIVDFEDSGSGDDDEDDDDMDVEFG